ncbi:MAG: twin arginine-targeting protein translocase TatC [Verrucomicrobiaceae bacterium]|nr:twin arginine-targeting protein translocase TatC [Verrucomicrobiaceae bacterium]
MSEPIDSQAMPLVAHLTELRSRLLRAVLAVGLILCSLLYFSNDIYSFFSEPLRRLLPAGSTMIATEVASTFFAPFKLTLVASLLISMPYILYQIWSFIAPGLYRHERRFAIPLFVSSILLFYLGMAFAYYITFPLVFGFFAHTAPEGVAYTPDITKFLDVALKMLFAFGFIFEIPIATVLLVWSGITTVDALAKKRPYVIVGCFVVGALLSPPDVLSQTLMALPMWLLFEAGVFFCRFIKRRDPNRAEADADDAD